VEHATHPWTRLVFVLDFTSRLLERGENPFGKALGEEKGIWPESSVSFSLILFGFFSFENYFFNLN
jgi:hypothetical protein